MNGYPWPRRVVWSGATSVRCPRHWCRTGRFRVHGRPDADRLCRPAVQLAAVSESALDRSRLNGCRRTPRDGQMARPAHLEFEIDEFEHGYVYKRNDGEA